MPWLNNWMYYTLNIKDVNQARLFGKTWDYVGSDDYFMFVFWQLFWSDVKIQWLCPVVLII